MLAGTAVLGLTASGLAARATPIDFSYTGSLVDFTVPTTGTYQILAFGGQGGSSHVTGGVPGAGGLGAEIGGNFTLDAGEVLQIAVGGQGAVEGGGGGGTFVVGPGPTPLVIAGGGGGGGAQTFFPTDIGLPGQGGLIGPDGGKDFLNQGGGTNGNGGISGGGAEGAGSGAGFLTGGGNSPEGVATGGGTFPGLAGGTPGGGFGGGGGAGINIADETGGGGGGGYSGGAGGAASISGMQPGSGGGSFDAGLDQILIADFQTGNGEVMITPVATPEPASLVLLGSALIGLAVVRRRWRSKT